jgi:hypothetical protein
MMPTPASWLGGSLIATQTPTYYHARACMHADRQTDREADSSHRGLRAELGDLSFRPSSLLTSTESALLPFGG